MRLLKAAARLSLLGTIMARVRYRRAFLLYRRSRLSAGREAITGEGRLSIGKRWPGQVAIPTELIVRPGGTLRVDGNFVIHRGGSVRVASGGKLTFGSGYIADHLHLECHREITIGHGVAIARCVSIMDTDHHDLTGARDREGPVHIGNRVWVGANVIILKGVTIGDGAVVAAGSVVTHHVAAGTLVAGVPARFIRNVEWTI